MFRQGIPRYTPEAATGAKKRQPMHSVAAYLSRRIFWFGHAADISLCFEAGDHQFMAAF